MEEVKISEEELAELKALDHEYAIRERKISKAWLAAHPGVSRGECNTPEMRALREEKNKNTLKLWRNTKSYFKNKQSNK